MPSEDTKILEFNQYQKSDKRPFAFYADFKFYLEKTDGYKNNLDKSFITKKGKYIRSGFSMSTKSSFKFKENIDSDKDCMKKFCESLSSQWI